MTTESNTICVADHERPYLLPRLINGEVQNTPLLHLSLSGVLPGLRRALRARGKANVPSNTASNQDVGPTAGVLDRSTPIGRGAIKW